MKFEELKEITAWKNFLSNPTKDPLVLDYWRRQLYLKDNNIPYTLNSPLEALAEKRSYSLLVYQKSTPKKMWRPFDEKGNYQEIDLTKCPKAFFEYLSFEIWQSHVLYFSEDMISLLCDLTFKVFQSYNDLKEKPSPKKWPYPLIWNSSSKGFKGRIYKDTFKEDNMSEISLDIDAELISTKLNPLMAEMNIDNIGYTSHAFKAENEAIQIYVSRAQQAQSDALSILLEEKICEIKEKRINNWARKKLNHQGLNGEERYSICLLRNVEYFSDKNNDDQSEHEKREYYHQWLVRGHVRNQWFPSKGTHEIIWVDPYIKGPEGSPFKETISHIAR